MEEACAYALRARPSLSTFTCTPSLLYLVLLLASSPYRWFYSISNGPESEGAPDDKTPHMVNLLTGSEIAFRKALLSKLSKSYCTCVIIYGFLFHFYVGLSVRYPE